MLALNLLGPVVLVHRDGALGLSIKKTQALLVLLALGGPQPRARVGALLWPQLDESTGRRNLRRELARLREAGAAQAVQADGDRLALSDALRCDVRDFEDALRQGQADRALAMWRGPPADGLELDDAQAFGDWLATERERLLGARRRALEASAAGHEARGDPEAALRRIESLLAEDALQEQHHRDAMRLHATCGRREAALAQYQRCCRLLKDELDLQPMAETEALAASLRGAPRAGPSPRPMSAPVSTVPAAAAPAARLPGQMPFVGRSTEVAALEAAWHTGQALLIEGEGGVGKTRLACDFVAAHGPYALVRCRAGDADVPYAAFTRALRALAGPTPDLGDLLPWVHGELSRLLPELGTPPPPLRSQAESSRFVEACTQAWLALATDSFDAVILDDWHHADTASQALLGFIAQRRREAGCGGAREVLVYRAELDEGAVESLRRLAQAAAALHLKLQPLPPQAVLELVQRLSGARSPQRFAARLGQATAGNPFFLAETLRHLVEQDLLVAAADGTWSTPFDDVTLDYGELPVPASVHEAVLARVQRLPAAGRRVLEAAALAAEPFMPALLAPACALSELDAVLAIEQAVAVQLLREHEAGGYAFAHDLVQQALSLSLSAERRRLVHRRLALGAEAAGAPAAVVALHHEASGDARRAVAHRLAAGNAAQRLYAWAEASEHWRQGLADGPTPGQTLALLLRSLRAAAVTGQASPAMAHARDLQSLAASGALSAEERVDGVLAVAGFLSRNEHAAEALDLLDRLPLPVAPRQETQAMTTRAVALRRLGRIDEGRAAALAALAMPAMPDPERASLLDAMCLLEGAAGRARTALEYAGALIALATRMRNETDALRGSYLRGNALLQLGELAAAETTLRTASQRCGTTGLVASHRAILYSLCGVHSALSCHAQMLAAARQGWELQPPLPVGEMRVKYRSALVEAHVAVGDLGAAWHHATQAVHEVQAVNEPICAAYWQAGCTELLALLGERKLALALRAAMDDAAMRQIPLFANEVWIAHARAALMTGDIDGAVHAVGQVKPAAQIEDPRVARMLDLLAVALALAQGHVARAVAALPALDTPGMSEELCLRALALEVAAQAQGGVLQPATVAAAQQALGTGQPHALAALYLHHALAAAQRAGVAGAPADARRAGAEHVARLADSLAAHPAQQAAFRHAWSA